MTILSRVRTSASLALAVGVLAVSVPGVASADPVPVPDVGRFYWQPWGVPAFAGVVNAVRVTDQGTILYTSIGRPATDAFVAKTGTGQFLGFGAVEHGGPTDITSSLRLDRLIDTANGKVYRPIQTTAHPVCVCTSMEQGMPTWDPKTQLLTFATVLPKLPAGTTSVDVDVNGRGLIVPNVPVTTGAALMPETGTGGAVVMGSGWPKLDLADAASVSDTSPFVTDLIANTESLDASQRTQTTTGSTSIAVSADVLFGSDKFAVTPAAKATLSQVAAKIKANGTGPVTVTGYTDSTNTAAYNLVLSRKRAASVVAALKPMLPGVTFTAQGKGEADPVASNSSPQGRTLNRRVTVSFATKGGS